MTVCPQGFWFHPCAGVNRGHCSVVSRVSLYFPSPVRTSDHTHTRVRITVCLDMSSEFEFHSFTYAHTYGTWAYKSSCMWHYPLIAPIGMFICVLLLLLFFNCSYQSVIKSPYALHVLTPDIDFYWLFIHSSDSQSIRTTWFKEREVHIFIESHRYLQYDVVSTLFCFYKLRFILYILFVPQSFSCAHKHCPLTHPRTHSHSAHAEHPASTLCTACLYSFKPVYCNDL